MTIGVRFAYKWNGGRFLDETLDGVVQRINYTLDRVVGVAKSAAPVRTGRLRRGIRVLRYADRNDIRGSVGVVNVPYAPYVIYGTRYRPPNPFFQRAYDQEIPPLIRSLNRIHGR